MRFWYLYSNPSLSLHFLYPGIYISHEFSGTTPPSDCLHPTYWRVIFNLSTPAKNKIKVTNFGIHICKLTKAMQKSLFWKITATPPHEIPVVKPLKPVGLFLAAIICCLDVRAEIPAHFRSRYLLIWKISKGAKYGTHLAYKNTLYSEVHFLEKYQHFRNSIRPNKKCSNNETFAA